MKRFGEVVVGAGVKTDDAIVNGVTRCQHEDRRRVAPRSQFSTDVEAVLFRQQHIKNHHIVRIGSCLLQRRGAVGRDVHGVRVLSKALGDHVGRRTLVFHEENSHGPLAIGQSECALER